MPIYLKVQQKYEKSCYLEAITLADKLIINKSISNDEKGILHYYTAASYYYLGKYTLALANSNKAIEFRGKNANEWQYYYRALSFAALNKLPEAIKDIDLAIAKSKNAKFSKTKDDIQSRIDAAALIKISTTSKNPIATAPEIPTKAPAATLSKVASAPQPKPKPVAAPSAPAKTSITTTPKAAPVSMPVVAPSAPAKISAVAIPEIVPTFTTTAKTSINADPKIASITLAATPKKSTPIVQKSIHAAALSEDLQTVKKMLSDDNYDLKNINGKTPLKLLLEKYESLYIIKKKIFIKKTMKNKFISGLLVPIAAKEIMVLLLQRGAATTARDQLLLIRLGIDVIGVKDELIRHLLQTQRRQTPLFTQIKDEQRSLRDYLKLFSIDLHKDINLAYQKIDEIIDLLNDINGRLGDVEDKAITIKSLVDNTTEILAGYEKDLLSLQDRVKEQDEIIAELNQCIHSMYSMLEYAICPSLSQERQPPQIDLQRAALPASILGSTLFVRQQPPARTEPVVASSSNEADTSAPSIFKN